MILVDPGDETFENFKRFIPGVVQMILFSTQCDVGILLSLSRIPT